MLPEEEAPGPSRLLKIGTLVRNLPREPRCQSLRQGVVSSPARGVRGLGQLPAVVLGTTPGAQRGFSIPGSWLVGALLPPSRQVSRSTPCYQLDSPAGRGPGRAILTRSLSLPAPPWEPLSVVLEFWVWLPPGTSVFLVLSRAGLAKKLWLVRPWGGGAAGESGWRVGGCDQAVRQHPVSNEHAQQPLRTREVCRSVQLRQPCHLLLEVRRSKHPRLLWC